VSEIKPAGRGKLALLLGLAAGLLVGGGGVGAYFVFFAGAEVKPLTSDDAARKTTFIRIDRLSAPLVSDGRVLGYALLDLSLEVRSNGDDLLVAQRMPALRDAFLRAVTDSPISRVGEPLAIDYDAVTELLRDVANRELRKDVVVRVLVTQTTRL